MSRKIPDTGDGLGLWHHIGGFVMWTIVVFLGVALANLILGVAA